MKSIHEILKNLLARKLILIYPDYPEEGKPIEVWPDLCVPDLSGVLQQVHDRQWGLNK